MALPQSFEIRRLAIAEQFVDLGIDLRRGSVVEEIVGGDDAAGREAHRKGRDQKAGAVHQGFSISRESGMIHA